MVTYVATHVCTRDPSLRLHSDMKKLLHLCMLVSSSNPSSCTYVAIGMCTNLGYFRIEIVVLSLNTYQLLDLLCSFKKCSDIV